MHGAVVEDILVRLSGGVKEHRGSIASPRLSVDPLGVGSAGRVRKVSVGVGVSSEHRAGREDGLREHEPVGFLPLNDRPRATIRHANILTQPGSGAVDMLNAPDPTSI
jgi:hypothetical protein